MPTIKTVSLASSALTPTSAKPTEYRYSTKEIVGMVLDSGAMRATLVSAIRLANYASESLKWEVQAVCDYLRECKAIRAETERLQAKNPKASAIPMRYASYSLEASAYHLALVKGTTSEKTAKEKTTLVITDEQAAFNVNYRQFWSRLLKDAGVESIKPPSTKRNSNKNKGTKAAPIFAKPHAAAQYWQGQSALMLKTCQANNRAGSISRKLNAPYVKAFQTFQMAIVAAAKLAMKDVGKR